MAGCCREDRGALPAAVYVGDQMLVRALITLAVGNHKYKAGDEFNAEPGVAAGWIKVGWVEAVRHQPEPELAIRSEPAEHAVTRRGRR